MARRVRVVVHGRVQNVGFRAFVQRTAGRLAVAGWVRNSEDPSVVELEAEGAEEAVEALVAAVRRGPAAARVREVQIEPLSATGADGGHFRVR